jgi:hypothetical protein
MNSDSNPRALRRAQNAETQRKRRANCVSLNEENDQRRARRVLPGVGEHESAQRVVARDEPGVREHENDQRRARRVLPGVGEHESAQRAVARDEPGVREHESAQRAVAREEPGVREHESAQRVVAREEPGVREHESAQRVVAREDPGVREHESAQRAATREDGTRRDEENNQRRVRRNETGVRENESAQRAGAREEPGVRERERRQRARRTFDMACKYLDGNYLFHQPCGLWNEPCVHGCGYLHLSSSSAGTRKKCCANGRLSYDSDNFDEELMMDHELERLPKFLRLLICSYSGFSKKSSTYNNLVAMAATAVCNYTNTQGFTRRGHGPRSVFMNGRVHHYMRIASTTSQNCGISYFIFDDIAALQVPLKDKMLIPLYCLTYARGLRMRTHTAATYDFLE